MKKILYITLMMSIVLTSCSDFLDVKPAGKLIPATGDVKSFDRLLNNTATIQYDNSGGSFLYYLCDDVEISDNQATYVWVDGHANIPYYFAYVFKMPYNNPNTTDGFWNSGIYKAAEYFNACIDGVNRVRTPAVESEASVTVAQATIARAWLYFNAALCYGPMYKPGGDNSMKVIPYRTTSDVTASMDGLSTTQEIFDRVLSDIHASLPYLPENPSFNTRFGKIQAYAFLANYHLFTQKYDSVAYYADKALTLAAQQKGSMDNLFYNMNLFTWSPDVSSNPDLRVNSLVVTNQGSDPLTATYGREMCLYRVSASLDSRFSTMAYPSTEFLGLFDAITDLRRQYFYFEYNGNKGTLPVPYDDGRRILSYHGSKAATTSGYSYPEILLMRAEGRARTNNLAGALEDLEYLFKFRHTTGTQFPTISGQDNIIQEVINERRRELPIGSPKRFYDLKRFCAETGKPWCKTSITHTVNGIAHTANADSDYFRLPISNDILRWNPQWEIPMNDAPWSNNK